MEWGTKSSEIITLGTVLFVLDKNGPLTLNVSQYNGRCFGSWNQRSPGQVLFILKPIKEVDNQSFIFRFVSNDPVAPDVFDIVQLIVRGKNFYSEFLPVLIVKGPWDPQFQKAGGPFSFLGVPCVFLKFDFTVSITGKSQDQVLTQLIKL